MIDLRLGRWEEALADVDMVDAVICDPPYGARTHAGADAVAGPLRSDGRDHNTTRRPIGYAAWTAAHVRTFVGAWADRCRGWMACMTSADLLPAYESAFIRAGWYPFTPLPLVSPGSRCRLLGDGPSNWTVFMLVARPRTKRMASWGTLPGAYTYKPERGMVRVGGKPLSLMRAIVRDYSRPGDLVCDPCAGGATTLLAAAIEGRRAVGAEVDAETFAKAQARIARGYTPRMQFDELTGTQAEIFDEAVS